MLDLMRRKASSWIIKFVLGLIIASFALFFGYTQLSDQGQEAERVVAMVGSVPIPRQKFYRLLDDQMDEARESGQQDPSPEFRRLFSETLLQQLVWSELYFLFAREIGLTIPDEILAREIQNSSSFAPKGVFDPVLYDQHRRSYQHFLGEDYEEAFRRDLARQRLQRLAEALYSPWEETFEKPIPPFTFFSNWIDPFRDEKEIKLYPVNF